MLPQFDRGVFDTSPSKIAKVDNLHIPDLPMLLFPQNLTQSKKYSYHVTYHVTPKSFEQFLPGICKLSTLAFLSGDMSNTSLSNCGNMRPHVTANPSSNCSLVFICSIYGHLQYHFQMEEVLDLKETVKNP